MTLQPPPGYEAGSSGVGNAPARDLADGVPDHQLGNPDGSWLRVIAGRPNPIHSGAEATGSGDDGHADDTAGPRGGGGVPADGSDGTPSLPGSHDASVAGHDDAGTRGTDRPHVIPARRVATRGPLGVDIVGGSTQRLNRVVALDRLASGYGYLTIEWSLRRRGYDLMALHENSTVTARGNTLAVDVSHGIERVLVATGTQGTMPLQPSELRVTNGATQIIVPIDGGTSLGVWPRLTLTRVDEFVVIRHEHDPLSGMLGAVAGAYGYDERTFVLAHTA